MNKQLGKALEGVFGHSENVWIEVVHLLSTVCIDSVVVVNREGLVWVDRHQYYAWVGEWVGEWVGGEWVGG